MFESLEGFSSMFEILASVLIGLILMGVGWTMASVSKMKTQTDDLHTWHKPNEAGQQTWKMNKENIEAIVTSVFKELKE